MSSSFNSPNLFPLLGEGMHFFFSQCNDEYKMCGYAAQTMDDDY